MTKTADPIIEIQPQAHPQAPSTPNQSPQTIDTDIVKATRDFVGAIQDEDVRFEMAKDHVINALRFDIINCSTKTFYMKVYKFQTSTFWQYFIALLSFVYMYLIVLQKTQYEYILKVGSPGVYCIFLVDFIMQTYHQIHDQFTKKARFSRLFYIKVIVGVLMGIDQLLMGLDVSVNGWKIHPFFIFRVCLPMLYNREILRCFMALGSAYKYIFLCFIFYGAVILVFALVCSHVIKMDDPSITTHPFKSNYNSLDKMIFITYVMGTYDAYPDNQIAAVQSSTFYYGIFILFIFLNMFIFTSIPGSIIFDKFIQTRGKLQLLDQLKMQNSLLVAFITIGEQNYQMDIQKIVKFLLYFYERRIRFTDIVTSICLKLNANDHTSIDINQFMQLGRILQQNANLRPPLFSDSQNWVKFRRYINLQYGLKTTINKTWFKFMTSMISVAAVITAALFLYKDQLIYRIMDQVFANVFVIQIFVYLVAIGPQNYFNQALSSVDCFIVLIGFGLQFVPSVAYAVSLLRLFRIYKAFFLFQLATNNHCWKINIDFYYNFQNLVKRMAIILPIILKLVPLFLIVLYSLGVVGMQTLRYAYQLPASPQNIYDKYSNFYYFIDTQFYFFQVLTEAGWSAVAYDVAGRNQTYFAAVMVMFCCFHVCVVIILATLIKGIVLSTFMAVTTQQQLTQSLHAIQKQQKQKQSLKFNEMKMLDQIIATMQTLKIDSLVKRDLYQTKLNQLLLDKLIRIHRHKKIGRHSIKNNRNSHLLRNFDINKALIDGLSQEKNEEKPKETQSAIYKMIEKFTRETFGDSVFQFSLGSQDYQMQIQSLCKKIKSLSAVDVSAQILPNPLLSAHLKTKIKTPLAIKPEDTQNDINTSTHLFDMHILLGIQTTWRQQKTVVIKGLLNRGAIQPKISQQLLHKTLGNKTFRLDQDCTVRKTYLQGTKPKLIQQFQAQYFGDLYGKAFKQINKVTIQPLIKLQSTMIYALKNICRYPQMHMHQFFRMLTKIQNTISNQLLKRGSLFKFVFQINCNKNIWFTIKLDGFFKPHISFLKNKTWIFEDYMKEHQIYHAPDLFKVQKSNGHGSQLQRAEMVKDLYETFQSLALTLQEKDVFFQSNPLYHVYDSFFSYQKVQDSVRLKEKQIQVSNIMVVMLTKQKQRNYNEEMPFQLSQIPIQKIQEQVQFKLDESQNETYRKLNRLAARSDQQASARAGLPLNYVLNFLLQIQDILKIHSSNFLYHVENLLNQQIGDTKDTKGRHSPMPVPPFIDLLPN